MAQTPLHVSAGNNRAEIVKFLLDWQGPEKVELEAKNMVNIIQLFGIECFMFMWMVCKFFLIDLSDLNLSAYMNYAVWRNSSTYGSKEWMQ